MARSPAKKPTDTRKKKTWAGQEGEDLHPINAQFKEVVESREHEPKDPCTFNATRVKYLPKRIAESDKHGGTGKGMKTKKVIDLDGSGAYTQGLGSLFGLVFVESRFFWKTSFAFWLMND